MATGIYMITNKINKKKYIGQSVNISKRLYEHKYKAFNKNDISYDSPIHQAFRKYGIENFDFSILTECTVDELDEKERDFISIYQTLSPKGYNILIGGQSFRAKQNYCVDCGVRIYKRATRCVDCSQKEQRLQERPTKEYLAEQIYLRGFVDVGREFGVSDNAIRKWCKGYDLPIHSKEIKEWWIKYSGIVVKEKRKVSNGSVMQIDKDTDEVINIFPSAVAAGEALGNKNYSKHISSVCSGSRKTAYGYKWKRITE